MNEDWDDMTAAEPLAGEELERLMARYARVRLDPGQAQLRRARGTVMEHAWRRRIDPTGAVASSALPHRRRGPVAGWSARRVGVSLSAAVLAGLMIGTSAFAGSRAGSPLYEPRLLIEALMLPSDPSARVDAHLEHAQARLAEAVEAAGRGDDAATAAALDAFDRTIDQVASIEGALAERALEAIRLHRSILLQVAANAPAGAANGLDRAIANSGRVILALATPGPGSGAGSGGASGNPGTGGPAGKPTADPGANATSKPVKAADPTATPKPTKTPKPTATPKPTDTPEPAATAEPTQKPGRTPPPRKTPNPGNTGGEDTGEPAPTSKP